MGQLTFQATLGGAVNLAGPNTATTTTFTLPSADGTNGQALQTNGSGTLSFATLPVAGGGTGATTLTANNVVLGNGTSAPLFVAPSTAGNVLTSNGTTWTSAAVASGLSGITQSASPFETSLGYQAGNATTGVDNTFVGYQTGLSNTSGTDNTAIGASALRDGTTTNYNTAVGKRALLVNTADGNTAVGDSSLDANTSGNSNVAIGQAALGANTTASKNVAVGSQALRDNTTGSENTGVGTDAGQRTTTGVFNTSIGSSALYTNTTGGYNTAIGRSSAYNITTGTQNTVIGTSAGASGTNDLTSGSNNILIGYNSAASSATVSNENTFGNSSTTSNRFWGDMKMGGSAAGTSGQVLTSAGAGVSPTWASVSAGFTLATPVSASGNASVTFSGIPAGVKQVNVMFDEVAVGSNEFINIRLGTSGGIGTSGYKSARVGPFRSGITTQPNADASNLVLVAGSGTGSNPIISGLVIFSLLNSTNNYWAYSGNIAQADNAWMWSMAGRSYLVSGLALTQLQIFPDGGVNFSGGTLSISYI